ncbi:MAG: hypothetical protein V3U75_04835 [Methylococcaceae bacterium]
MATVNFSIPEEVKTEFNELFSSENKSALLTEFIKKAIEERKAEQQRLKAMQAIFDIRSTQKPVTNTAIQSAKKEYRE